MDAMLERSLLGAIECHELFGEFDEADVLKGEYDDKINHSQQKDVEMKDQQDHIYEGTLVASDWDRLDNVSQSSLFTQEDEDILLDHSSGMKKFRPYLNQKVRILGKIVSINRDGKKVLVKKITRIIGDFKKSRNESLNGFDENILSLM